MKNKSIITLILCVVLVIFSGRNSNNYASAAEETSLSGQAHVQTFGDKAGSYKDGILTLGTTGQSKRLEGIQIRLTGELANHYSVKYRVHIQSYGWNQGWQYDGALAGTEGEAKRLESLEVQLVPKTEDMGLIYRVHRQAYGWEMPYKSNGTVSGTTGQSKRLEGIEIALTGNKYSGSIIYSTHVQSYGWMNEVSDGMMSGTSGKAKRLESIKIRLDGEVAEHYDIYYRVHAQSYGWLGWAKNGEPSGTAGYGKRLEAIQIILVDKGSAAPTKVDGIESNTTTPYVDKAIVDKCNHNWVAQTKVVHHDAVGHMETKGTYIDASGNDYGANPQIVIAGGKECVLVGYDPYLICNACGTKFYQSAYGGVSGSESALREHQSNNGHGSSSAYSDPIYIEVFYKEIAVFEEDKPAYDETVTTGYKCSICGTAK